MAARHQRSTRADPPPRLDPWSVRRHADIGGVAVFDLDRTLLPGSSLVALGRAMAAAGMVSRRRLVRAAVQEASFRRRGATDGSVEALRDDALSHIAGRRRAELHELVQQVAEQLVGQMTPAARFLVDRHRAAGDFVVVLSASPQELVEAVVARVGAHRGVGTRAEVVDDTFTGRLDGPFCYGEGKLARLAADVGHIDLAATTAYADSASDLPLLVACGRPVAVNPDRRLREVAVSERWPVLTLR